MPKVAKTYELFIAAPSDIISEKGIIKQLCQEWNNNFGRSIDARIETTDWSDAYPIMGKRPQAIINDQIFDESDFVVAIFWTKFGSSTGIADSGTEEEILRAHQQKKPLLLYFSNKMRYPSEIDKTELERVNEFKNRHQADSLYATFSSDEEFEKEFRKHLSTFMHDLIKGKFAEGGKSLPLVSIKNQNEKKKKVDEDYKPVEDIKKILKDQFKVLWGEAFGILEDGDLQVGNMRFKKNNKKEVESLKKKLTSMEVDVVAYRDSCFEFFNDNYLAVLADDLDAFKYEVFAKELWTVHSALTDFSNQELDTYRTNFENATSSEIYDHVLSILAASQNYVNIIFPNINLKLIKHIKDLELDFLNAEEMIMTGIIGLGVRSELLHRLHPGIFPIMTRRSLWGMFFLTNESEFVIDENRSGRSRTSHRWAYEYDRFCFYNNFLMNIMEEYLLKHKIKIKPELRYGYINLLLVEFGKKHQDEISKLYAWKNTGL